MFLKVVRVDKFLKSSVRPCNNLTDGGIKDICKLLVLLKEVKCFYYF